MLSKMNWRQVTQDRYQSSSWATSLMAEVGICSHWVDVAMGMGTDLNPKKSGQGSSCVVTATVIIKTWLRTCIR